MAAAPEFSSSLPSRQVIGKGVIVEKNFGIHLAVAVLLIGSTASAFEVEFNESSWCTNGVEAGTYDKEIPAGWTATSRFKESFLEPGRGGVAGISALKFNTWNEENGETGFLRMGSKIAVPRSEIVCDNIDASVKIYVRPLQDCSVDKIQLIATTNDWEETISIGTPVPIRDASYSTGWRTIPVRDKIEGISRIGSDVALRIGVKVIAGGVSTTYVFLHSLTINFVACATPEKPVLVSANAEIPSIYEPLNSTILPGDENGRMAVKINVSPEDKVGELTVYGVLTRNNGVIPPVTNELVKVGDVYYEKIEDALARPCFDAGESITISVFTKYKSTDSAVSPLGEVGVDGFAREFSGSTSYNVGKQGSVWINELGQDDTRHCFVELCGTTNRAYLGGWKVVLSGVDQGGELMAYTNDLVDVFDFATNMVNGVIGIETYRWVALDAVEMADATLELVNSAGVVEFLKTDISSFPAHYQMTGKAKWHGKNDDDWSYDWTGTATNKTFTFGSSDAVVSFGRVNYGQGFRVPVGTKLYYTTMIQGNDGMIPLPYASILVDAEGILNDGEGKKSFPAQPTGEDGTACIQISGYSDDAHEVPIEIAVSAFAWKSDNVKTNITLYGESVWITNFVSATIAYDDFSKLQDYWQNESAIRNPLYQVMYWQSVDGELRLDTNEGFDGSAFLTTKSYMALRGKRNIDISFRIKNERYGVISDCTKVMIVITDSIGNRKETVAIANKSKQYQTGAWYSVREVINIPDDFAVDGKIWIRVRADKTTGETGVYTTLDDLRIAAQDSVKINEFKMDVPAGEDKHFPLESKAELDISPLTGGIVSNFVEEVLVSVETNYVRKVAADLMLKINGTEFAVPFSFADGTLTNDISAAEKSVKLTVSPSMINRITGGFLPGDEVQYYARVTYDPDDADDSGKRDERYYPDNATATANGWRVENGYGVKKDLSENTFTVDGPALILVGEPATTTNGVKFAVHGYLEDGLSDVTVAVSSESGEKWEEHLLTSVQVRVTGEFELKTGLSPSTTYHVTITAKDKDGNPLTGEGTSVEFDFKTRPGEIVITGTPEEGDYSPTKAFDFYALAEAEDATKLNFHWLLNGKAAESGFGNTNYTDEVAADGLYTVGVYATDKVSDKEEYVSPTNSLSWVVDTTKPTRPDIMGTPANESVTNGVAYELTAESEDANLDAFYWILDGAAGVRALPEKAFKDSVADGFGTHVVKCYAVDKAGNVSETNDWTWTVDTLAPTNLTFTGRPVNGKVTKDPTYRLMATALDDMERTYHWLLEDGTEVTTAEDAYLDREVDGDGKHAVRYYATDKAGNSSVTNTLSWTVDRKAPTGVRILGAPAGDPAVTNEATLCLSAVADDDLTTITYHWLTNGVAAVTATNFEVTVTRDGAFTVSCYATDEAQNVSETNSVSWILDTVAPTVPILTDVLENGVVTSNKAYKFSATATDLTRIDFTWVLSGGETGTATRDDAVTAAQTGGYYGDVKADGVYTITVFAKDAAGNGPVSTNWTWTVDTTPPRIIGMDATPDEGDVVATNGFDFTVFMKDATELTYRWVLNGVTNDTCTTSNYVDTAAIEGTNTVSVFAEDAAHNVCEPTNLTWVVDLHAPTNVTIHGWPMGKGTVITNGTNFVFTATAEDDTALRFFWSLNGGEVMEKAVFTSADARVREETNTVSVYAKDEAGNVSEANSWSWIVDTTPPVIKALIGKPENGALTNDQMFDFKVLATDKTAITYYWTTNDFAVTDNFTSNLVGRAIEGTNTVSVYVEDAAHNFSVTTNTVRWTLDTFHPTVKLSTGTGEEDIINATEDFFVTATFSEPVTNFTTKSVSVDNGSVVSIATNAEANVYVVKIVPKDDGPISVQIAENAVTDLAGNGNEPSTNDHGEQAPLTRTCDITLPGVSLSSSTPTYFNRKVGYMTVTVTFTEPVGGFTKNSLTIVTGQESWEVVSNEANKVFTLRVWPDNYSDEKYIGQEKITVNVLAGVVTDAAGNPNTAAAADLTKTYDTLTPTVDITSENVPDPERYFNEDKKPLLVTIVVSGSNVTELASSSVVVTNGTFTFAHTEAQEKQDIYKLEVTPLSNGVVTVLVPAGVVTNASQNVNEQPEPLVRIYDSEAPTGLRIVGSPETNKVVATTYFKFDALARDNLMQPQELEYHWILNGESRDGTSSHYEGDVPKGTNWVSVYATDAAGNSCEPVRRTWVVDYLNPTNLVLTGTPALEDRIVVTTETNFNFVATAEDETRISYLWTTNGADVADNLTTNLTGIAIEGTNVVTVTAMDEASNRWEYGEKVLTRTWVVDTLAPSNLAFVACTPKAGAVVATNGFSFTASAQDATHLTYHWILNGVTNQTCTSANFVGTTALEGTNTVSVYAEDEAHNISAATNLTWVVDMTDPEQLELSGAPEQGDVIAATNFEFHAEAKDDTKLKFRWTLNTKVVDITTADFVDALAVEGTNTVTVYAEDEAGNTCAPTSRWWVVDTIAPSNLHFVATLPAAGDVMNGAAFAFTVQAEDATQLKYHWLTNGTEVADHYDPSFGGTAVEGTNTVSVYAEDEAHNVSLTNHISWIYDFKAPSTPEIVEGAPRSGATNITAFAFTAQSKDDWSRITYHWSLTDGKTATGQTFKSDVDGDDGIYTMSVWAEDEAHNVSETNSWSWTLDRIEPVMPTITGTPASNSYVNVALFNLYAKLEKDDATAVSFHWTLDEDKTETVASNFTKSVTTEGPHTAYVYARDAAGNVSETNSWSWTYDNTPPKLLPIVGTPSNGSVTNAVDYGLQGQADEVNPVKFYWTLDGVTMDTTDRDAWFKGEVPEDYSNHVVTCYAEDAAGNVSVETNVLCWTVDTLAPTNLVISGMPANLATTNGVAYRLTATAEDDMKRTYHWALDGDAKTADLDEGVAFEGDVASGYGTHVVTCYATDVAGNVSETNSWSWTVDTKLPVLQDLSGLPEDGALTNDPSFDFLVSAEDDTALTYHWTHLTTNGYESVDNQTTNYFGTVTNSLGAVIEGLHVVSVYAEDRAHNVSETNSISWTVDVTPPTVTLESSTSSLFNKSQSPMIVEVTFSEPVTNFTAALLTVTNGNVAAMEVITNNPVSYTVAVTPARDGEVPVMVKANIATDLAGNGNVASDTLTRNCDITLPTVTLDCPLFDRLVGFDDVTEDGLYAVTVTFSEPVTNFVKSSLTVNNCEVDSVTGEGADYTVMIRPSDGTNTIQIAADAVVDRAGNGNVASLERKCVYDSTPPTQPVISGTPGCGETTTSKSFNLTVETWDANGVDYYVWVVDGDEIVTDVPSLSGVVGKGLHTVSVYVFDKVLNMSDESEEYGWTVEDASGANIEFGGGVYLEVNPETHSTNSVEFTAVDFKPGADSTVTMHGFGVDPLPANAEAPNVFELKMRLVVSDSLGGERWHVTVKETAHFDTEAKDLTVTIPEAEMKHGTPAEPYDRLFIFGVDNKER